MKHIRFGMAIVGLALFGAGSVGLAAEKYDRSKQVYDLGKQEYDANCAVCHGLKGKGDGSYGELLKTRASDLTVLSKNNGGVFPVARVYDVIDGRQAVKAHGERDMPIWGRAFIAEAGDHWVLPGDSEALARARILALIEYISRIQVK